MEGIVLRRALSVARYLHVSRKLGALTLRRESRDRSTGMIKAFVGGIEVGRQLRDDLIIPHDLNRPRRHLVDLHHLYIQTASLRIIRDHDLRFLESLDHLRINAKLATGMVQLLEDASTLLDTGLPRTPTHPTVLHHNGNPPTHQHLLPDQDTLRLLLSHPDHLEQKNHERPQLSRPQQQKAFHASLPQDQHLSVNQPCPRTAVQGAIRSSRHLPDLAAVHHIEAIQENMHTAARRQVEAGEWDPSISPALHTTNILHQQIVYRTDHVQAQTPTPTPPLSRLGPLFAPTTRPQRRIRAPSGSRII